MCVQFALMFEWAIKRYGKCDTNTVEEKSHTHSPQRHYHIYTKKCLDARYIYVSFAWGVFVWMTIQTAIILLRVTLYLRFAFYAFHMCSVVTLVVIVLVFVFGFVFVFVYENIFVLNFFVMARTKLADTKMWVRETNTPHKTLNAREWRKNTAI